MRGQNVVTPITTKAANDAVQQAISQTAQAFQGVVTPRTIQAAAQTVHAAPQAPAQPQAVQLSVQ